MKWMGMGARILAVSLMVLSAGCGGGADDGTGDTPPPPATTGIGTAGGTVTEASGAKVVIPSGALTANTDIQVAQSSAGAPALPSGVTAVSAIYAFTPHGTTFAKPVTVTLPFDPTKLTAGHTPRFFKTNAARTAYEEVPGATVSGSTITADITSFSNGFAGVTSSFALGGTVTGLVGSGLHLQTNLINDVSPTTDGPYTFPRRLDEGTTYSVSIVTQPTNPSQVCTSANGTGTIAGSDVTNVAVTCVTPPPPSGIDTGFGSQGKVFTIGQSVRAMVQEADGKLLTLGGLSLGGFTLTRYNTDGTVNATFPINTGGAVADTMNAFALQSDGKIVVAGVISAPPSANVNWLVMRLNADGTPDNTFGTGGRVETDFGGHFDNARAVMLQPDGKIVVAGYAQIDKLVSVGGANINVIDQDLAAARYLPNGTLDTTFDSDGKATVDAGAGDYGNAAALQTDGSIVIVGRTTVPGGTENPDMIVARMLGNGIADPAFGSAGVERIDLAAGVVPPTFTAGETDEALDVAIQGDGEILVAGYTAGSAPNTTVASLLQLGTTGALEHNFAPVIPPAINRINAIAIDNGRIVIAGTAGSDFGVARLLSSGTLDDAFGTHGLFTVDFFGSTDAALDVLLQSDGRVVAGGSARNGSSGGAGLVRVTP